MTLSSSLVVGAEAVAEEELVAVEPARVRAQGLGVGAALALALARALAAQGKYDWVLEFDIKGLFDNIDQDLLMRAARKHTDRQWMLLYIERWLKAPFQGEERIWVERAKGIPQGGVISPLLANLFLQYVFDKRMERNYPQVPFCRYADDGVVHCRVEAEAGLMKEVLESRFKECNLELHSEKTRIIYCKDENRRGEHPHTMFDFLGFTFRPRRSKNRWGKSFITFVQSLAMRRERR